MQYLRIFEPARIGKMDTKNRIKFAATGTGFCSKVGEVTEREIAWLEERAKGGSGLVTTAGTAPHPTGVFSDFQIRNWDESHIPELRKLAKAVKKHGAKSCVQIVHAGRYANLKEGLPVGPSAVPSKFGRWQNVRELSLKEIETLIEAHGEAARRGKEAGFDSLEIGAMAGYLIASFLSPWTNRRADEYGGNIENRARFLLKCIDSIRERVGADYPVLVRMCADELMEGGNAPQDMIRIAKLLEKTGVDAISLTVGWHESRTPSLTMDIPQGHWLYLAEGMKRVLSIPVCMAFRLHSADIAEKAIEDGKLDFWEMSRPLIADPELANKLAQGRDKDIVPCVSCMQGCFARIFNYQPITCLMNPRVGKEADESYLIKPAPVRKKVLVVGGGPAGLQAARMAAMRGHEVILYEKGSTLGGQLEQASRSPHRGELGKVTEYLSAQIKELGVKVVLQQKVTPVLVRKMRPQVVILATGSSPIIPKITGSQNLQVVSAYSVLRGEVEVGYKILVWGGRQVGVQTAEFLASEGKEVTIIEESAKLGKDITVFDIWGFRARLSGLGVRVMTNCSLKEIVSGGVVVVAERGEESILVDTVVVALKYRANKELWKRLAGEVGELHAVGDCVAPRKAINAIREGFKVGVQI